jgi:hypothetical protein
MSSAGTKPSLRGRAPRRKSSTQRCGRSDGGDAIAFARGGNAGFTRQKENSDQADRDIKCRAGPHATGPHATGPHATRKIAHRAAFQFPVARQNADRASGFHKSLCDAGKNDAASQACHTLSVEPATKSCSDKGNRAGRAASAAAHHCESCYHLPLAPAGNRRWRDQRSQSSAG